MNKNPELINWVKDGVGSGEFAADEKLPTEQELSEKFGISRYGVRKALESMEKEGFLYKIQGSGSYISPNAGELAGGAGASPKSGIIGLVLQYNEEYIFPEVIRGVSEELAKNKYALSLHCTDNNIFKEREALKGLMEMNPDGIILEPSGSLLSPYNNDLYTEISSKIPILMLHTVVSKEWTTLSMADREGARRLVRYLVELGHEKIGTVFFLDNHTGSSRYLGVLDELRTNGISSPEYYSVWCRRNSIEEGYLCKENYELEKMLSEVTAIFCHDDRLAVKMIEYLQTRGIKVPEDISIVGYDDMIPPYTKIKPTTIEHAKAEYGINAARAIIELIDDPNNVNMADFEIPPKMVIGDSTARRK